VRAKPRPRISAYACGPACDRRGASQPRGGDRARHGPAVRCWARPLCDLCCSRVDTASDGRCLRRRRNYARWHLGRGALWGRGNMQSRCWTRPFKKLILGQGRSGHRYPCQMCLHTADAQTARNFHAQGDRLLPDRAYFFDPSRLTVMREMIFADTAKAVVRCGAPFADATRGFHPAYSASCRGNRVVSGCSIRLARIPPSKAATGQPICQAWICRCRM